MLNLRQVESIAFSPIDRLSFVLAASYWDFNDSLNHSVTFVITDGVLDGSNYWRQNDGYSRRKFSICSMHFVGACYYASEHTNGLKVYMESIYHAS